MRPAITRDPASDENTGPDWLCIAKGRYKEASPYWESGGKKKPKLKIVDPPKKETKARAETACGCSVQYAKQFCPCGACR